MILRIVGRSFDNLFTFTIGMVFNDIFATLLVLDMVGRIDDGLEIIQKRFATLFSIGISRTVHTLDVFRVQLTETLLIIYILFRVFGWYWHCSQDIYAVAISTRFAWFSIA